MRQYARILSRIRSEMWAVRPETLRAIYDTVMARHEGLALPAEPSVLGKLDTDGTGLDENTGLWMAAPGVAVIPVIGVIGQRLSLIESMCGGYDLMDLQEQCKTALAEDSIHSVIFYFDSPGGAVTGLPEAAACVRALSEIKNTVAYTDTMCCSAAYYLASQCNAVASTRSCTIGSIGTIMAWVDGTGAMEKEGYKLMCFQGGKYKSAGIEGREMTAEESALFQGRVDKCYQDFKDKVTATRPQVAEETMQGQAFTGAEGAENGLVDEIVQDMDEVVAALSNAA